MKIGFCLAGVCLFPVVVQAQTTQEKCLLDALANLPENATVSQVRAACAAPEAKEGEAAPAPAPVPTAASAEALPPPIPPDGDAQKLATYRMNYLLPLTYDQHRPSSAPFRQDVTTADDQAQKIEMKYQISFKFPVLPKVLGSDGTLYAGYTQRSFWQMYNTQASRPFRETNYEPEVWYQYPVNFDLLGWRLTDVHAGLDHQSNGRGQAYSRSWNRIMGGLNFEHGPYVVELRPWWRIKEDPKNDDNPDIAHYMGSFELGVGRQIGAHFLGLTVRNNLEGVHNRGAVQLDWTFPLFRSRVMRGYVQWFNGYGESLIDYNVRQNAIGAGVQLVDW